jgi:hypothetical protein
MVSSSVCGSGTYSFGSDIGRGDVAAEIHSAPNHGRIKWRRNCRKSVAGHPKFTDPSEVICGGRTIRFAQAVRGTTTPLDCGRYAVLGKGLSVALAAPLHPAGLLALKPNGNVPAFHPGKRLRRLIALARRKAVEESFNCVWRTVYPTATLV